MLQSILTLGCLPNLTLSALSMASLGPDSMMHACRGRLIHVVGVCVDVCRSVDWTKDEGEES